MLFALFMSTAACGAASKPPNLSDAQVERIRAEEPGMKPRCLQALREGGVDAFPGGVQDCFEMTPRQRWSGLWRDEFEGSRFCPAPASKCLHHTPGDKIWLSFKDEQSLKRSQGGLYTVEFEGRRTLRRGHHGHLGMSNHEMIVDRLISIKEIEAPYRPTRKDYESMKRQCRMTPGCSVEKIEEAERMQFGGRQK